MRIQHSPALMTPQDSVLRSLASPIDQRGDDTPLCEEIEPHCTECYQCIRSSLYTIAAAIYAWIDDLRETITCWFSNELSDENIRNQICLLGLDTSTDYVRELYQPLFNELREKGVSIRRRINLLKLDYIPQTLYTDPILSQFTCGIHYIPMRFATIDPTVPSDNSVRSCEKSVIEQWVQTHGYSPLTSANLTVHQLQEADEQPQIDARLKAHSLILTHLVQIGRLRVK